MNNLKLWMKNQLPVNVTTKALVINNDKKLRNLAAMERKRYVNSMATFVPTDSLEQLRSRMQFHVHALEKGLSHRERRLGFGKNALQLLGTTLKVYREKGYDKHDADYQAALSVINQYILFHNQEQYNTDYLTSFFSPELLKDAQNISEITGGVKTIFAKDKQNTPQMTFAELAKQRVSIRDFADEAVDPDIVLHAINMCLHTPSVCNRQPARVYLIKQPDLIKEVLHAQGGFTGYDLPPILLLVTVDNRAFLSIHERNEGYIDGGLFAMSLLYALEADRLAACALNAMLTEQAEKQIRSQLSIHDSEHLIMFVAVGKFPAEARVPLSRRKSLEEIVTIK